ncbi:MAG: hypothetical protein V7L20_00780 [Nostoc sp.]|uniref:hypothetical protein n=1 Tax=Nostoc sp. TaxID=1180 RepID=UPI002FF9C899
MSITHNNRDNFSEGTKKTLAERAAYLCSNPNCRSLTVTPHSDSNKSLKTGIAAHICAAAPDGPRYDPNQTQEERKSIDNGIWLCHNCSDIVDKDEQRYTKATLVQWKQQHEIFVIQDGGIPLLPYIEMSTLTGLSMPSTGSFTITAEHVEYYRENILCIENRSGRVLNYFQARIQLPEPVVRLQIFEQPPGENVVCQPDTMNLMVYASGEGSSVSGMGSRPALDYKIKLGSLPPRSRLEIHFFCVRTEEFTEDSNFGTEDIEDEEVYVYHIRGEFQYPLMNEYLKREFLVILDFDKSARSINSQVCEDFDESKQLVERMIFW